MAWFEFRYFSNYWIHSPFSGRIRLYYSTNALKTSRLRSGTKWEVLETVEEWKGENKLIKTIRYRVSSV
jgi:hypothetical protein